MEGVNPVVIHPLAQGFNGKDDAVLLPKLFGTQGGPEVGIPFLNRLQDAEPVQEAGDYRAWRAADAPGLRHRNHESG
ncbi:Uncharacterised protein [Salmonella enterica]|nr:hypothetical protein LFZ1_13100 [Salmonella enterica subsp. enterica serovar Rubislaw str. SA20030553]SUF22638.1 Uncharacterised protein [Salmonella enterica]